MILGRDLLGLALGLPQGAGHLLLQLVQAVGHELVRVLLLVARELRRAARQRVLEPPGRRGPRLAAHLVVHDTLQRRVDGAGAEHRLEEREQRDHVGHKGRKPEERREHRVHVAGVANVLEAAVDARNAAAAACTARMQRQLPRTRPREVSNHRWVRGWPERLARPSQRVVGVIGRQVGAGALGLGLVRATPGGAGPGRAGQVGNGRAGLVCARGAAGGNAIEGIAPSRYGRQAAPGRGLRARRRGEGAHGGVIPAAGLDAPKGRRHALVEAPASTAEQRWRCRAGGSARARSFGSRPRRQSVAGPSRQVEPGHGRGARGRLSIGARTEADGLPMLRQHRRRDGQVCKPWITRVPGSRLHLSEELLEGGRPTVDLLRSDVHAEGRCDPRSV